MPWGPGVYDAGGSRKHLVQACEASLRRLGLDHVDLFYHHCPDPETPLDETAEALAHLVWQGKALYIGLSKYPLEDALRMKEMLAGLGAPCVAHQARFKLLERGYAAGMDALDEAGLGSVIFSPLAQGRLSNRYLDGIPADSRAAKAHGFLTPEAVEAHRDHLRRLHAFAQDHGASLSALALAWVLRHEAVASVVLGASRPAQIEANAAALDLLQNPDAWAPDLDALLEAEA